MLVLDQICTEKRVCEGTFHFFYWVDKCFEIFTFHQKYDNKLAFLEKKSSQYLY